MLAPEVGADVDCAVGEVDEAELRVVVELWLVEVVEVEEVEELSEVDDEDSDVDAEVEEEREEDVREAVDDAVEELPEAEEERVLLSTTNCGEKFTWLGLSWSMISRV